MIAKIVPTSTVLVSQPGILCDSMHIMLKSLPPIEVVEIASGCLSASKLLNKEALQLMVLDATLPEEEVLELLDRVKKNYPHVPVLTLAMTTKHRETLVAAGADSVILRNSSAHLFIDAIQQTILSQCVQ